jgi:cytochrome c-type biogenesis protein CcmH/NrfF
MTLPASAIALAACASIAAFNAAAQDPARAVRSSDQAVRAFETVREVLQHPRCQNCHIPGNAPLQYDQGLPHAMNVQRGRDGLGAVG